ncbi:metalloproteinase [Aphelenchoides avenae]|nr:metalloproteinase [Aphelenchus avenae]
MRTVASCLALCVVAVYAVPVQVKNVTSLNQVEDPEKLRDVFLKGVSKLGTGYNYLKRIAVQAQKKRALLQRKGATADDEAKFRAKNYGIQAANLPLKDFLYQGDILLNEAEAIGLNFTKEFKQRKAGGKFKFTSGQEGPDKPKWPHDRPICYVFGVTAGQPLDQNSVKLARSAFKWWTENSCLEWKEGCADKPVMTIDDQGACFTHLGPDTENSFSKDASGQWKVPPFAAVMPMSLNWDGCGGTWSTPAHEASHAMGMNHEMARPDRDQFEGFDWSGLKRIGADDQYDIADTSDTLGTLFDYGSNMHYQAFLSSGGIGPSPDVIAKEKEYQHSMGSMYGPVFLDVFIVNKYNDCIKEGGIACQNEGFPHPRAPTSKCYCPEGFGGPTCADREQGLNGAPPGCGETLQATAEWKQLQIDGPAAPNRNLQNNGLSGIPYAERAAACTWWIQAPAGKTVEVKVDSVEPKLRLSKCLQDCSLEGIEVKFGDKKRSGPRLCCAGHEKELGTVTSKTNLAIIRHWTLIEGVKATVSYRTSSIE